MIVQIALLGVLVVSLGLAVLRLDHAAHEGGDLVHSSINLDFRDWHFLIHPIGLLGDGVGIHLLLV